MFVLKYNVAVQSKLKTELISGGYEQIIYYSTARTSESFLIRLTGILVIHSYHGGEMNS